MNCDPLNRRMKFRHTGGRVVCLFAVLSAVACRADHDAVERVPAREQRQVLAPDPAHDYLLHLPGVAGETRVDHGFIEGIKAGGFEGETEIYDWTNNDPGLGALRARKRNDQEAAKVAEKIRRRL